MHPELERFPLRFGRGADGLANEAFHGDRWFRHERYDGDMPDEPPQEWLAYPGLYRNDDPWMPTLRVVLRKGRLALQFPVELSDEAGEAELQPLETAGSRRGSPGSRGASGSTVWWTAGPCSRSSTPGAGTARSRTERYPGVKYTDGADPSGIA